jgi:hypothetical protein
MRKEELSNLVASNIHNNVQISENDWKLLSKQLNVGTEIFRILMINGIAEKVRTMIFRIKGLTGLLKAYRNS